MCSRACARATYHMIEVHICLRRLALQLFLVMAATCVCFEAVSASLIMLPAKPFCCCCTLDAALRIARQPIFKQTDGLSLIGEVNDAVGPGSAWPHLLQLEACSADRASNSDVLKRLPRWLVPPLTVCLLVPGSKYLGDKRSARVSLAALRQLAEA